MRSSPWRSRATSLPRGKLPDFADSLLDAARTMFASSANCQSIFSRVTGELLGLPAVAATTDPSNVALRGALGGATGPMTLSAPVSIGPAATLSLGAAGPVPTSANDQAGTGLAIRQNFVDLTNVTQAGHNAEIVVLREEFEGLRGEVREIVRAMRLQQDRPRLAGTWRR